MSNYLYVLAKTKPRETCKECGAVKKQQKFELKYFLTEEKKLGIKQKQEYIREGIVKQILIELPKEIGISESLELKVIKEKKIVQFVGKNSV